MGGEKAYVLINDQIMEEGDVISGKRIVTIESDKVILEQGGRKFTLVLGE
jgi:type II secretory pathway component PulC